MPFKPSKSEEDVKRAAVELRAISGKTPGHRLCYKRTMQERFHEFYRALLRSDPRYDRVFLVGVRTTGIYCLPSCRARKPRPKNVRFFLNRAAAEQAGFRPCRKCRPEVQGGRRAVEESLLHRARALLNGEEPPQAKRVAELTGVSVYRLNRLFKRYLNRTPQHDRMAARTARACALLAGTTRPLLEVCFEVGFESVSSFYRWFHRLTGTTPGAYRRQMRRQSAPRVGAERRSASIMETTGVRA